RLLPATLKEGSTIFLWKGLQKEGNDLIPQEIRCSVNNRRLIWDFDNFFLIPDYRIDRISLSGDQLIPGKWSHHMVTYDSETGLLEYKINNIPSDNTYTTISRHESKEFNVPIIGNQQSFPIEIGANFSGLIDEFRICKRKVNSPILNKYHESGYLETTIIDFKIPDSKLQSIMVDSNIPENTNIKFQYKLSNNKIDLYHPDTEWYDFIPSIEINRKGQFLIIRSIFFSEKATNNAPVLSNYQVNFIKAEKPLPPVFLSIEKNNGSILLSWNESINPEIEGYLVYYGEEPGNYFSLGSPQDSGLANYIMLEGLEQNKRYYFSVTSYKSLNPRLESIFSQEISITP
ncbi:MAG: hypothetical protein GY760_29365, partial [Deltaproteobacteria bacterium]|nr:hypothetical protein [Deltaproteobacteria bacterium]